MKLIRKEGNHFGCPLLLIVDLVSFVVILSFKIFIIDLG